MPLVILHHFLNVLVQLANKRGLKKVTFTTRRETCPPVHINDMKIPQENHVNYLGLHLDRRLTWHTYIFAKRKQARTLAHQDVLVTRTQVQTLNQLQTYHLQRDTNTYLDIRHSILGYNIQFKHRHFRTLSIQSIAANSECPLVRLKFHHPSGHLNTNSKRRNQPIQLP
jgi:hypothetical protein